MKRNSIGIALIVLLVSCSSMKTERGKVSINDIKIETQGNSLDDSNEMREVCRRFQLTRKQVLVYYSESRLTNELEIHDKYNIFPCFSTGTISIENDSFAWTIRAGGVGEFYNEKQINLRVCDDKCCKLTSNIC